MTESGESASSDVREVTALLGVSRTIESSPKAVALFINSGGSYLCKETRLEVKENEES
jgi:hypothetical protein